MNATYYYGVSAFFNGLLGLFLVYYVYLRNKKNPLNRSFLYFGIAVSGWSLIYSLWAWASNAVWAERYVRTHMMFEAFIPATFFHFVSQFTQRDEHYRKLRNFFYLLSAIYSPLMQTRWMIAGVKNVLFFHYWPIPGPLLLSHVVQFFIAIACSFLLLFRRLFEVKGFERRQTLWVIIAFVIGFGGGSTNWFLWFDIPIPPLTNFFAGVTFAILTYVIVRYGLMDMDVIVEVQRTSRAAAIGLVASSLNHELRNPLYVSQGRIESQLDAIDHNIFSSAEEEAAKSREVLQIALYHLNRARDIMQRFSDFARSQPQNGKKENVAVKEALEEVLGLVGHEFELKKIRLVEAPLDGESIQANRRQFEEILFNLIINACHAMGEGGGELKVSASQPNGRVLIEIADTGPGIPKENQRKIFEPFYSTKGEKGSGLGLYITKQLVERNGGKISVRSKPGQGTKFLLEFVHL